MAKQQSTRRKVQENLTHKMGQVFIQARQSLKLLETLEKDTLAKAKGFVRMPRANERKKLANEKILASLRRLGVSAKTEVDELRLRVQRLEEELFALRGTRPMPARPSSSKSKGRSPEALPRV